MKTRYLLAREKHWVRLRFQNFIWNNLVKSYKCQSVPVLTRRHPEASSCAQWTLQRYSPCNTQLRNSRLSLSGLLSILVKLTQSLRPKSLRSSSKFLCALLINSDKFSSNLRNADDIAQLKKICKDLENMNIEEEKKISENHVTIENLTMNLSLHQRTITGLVEDRKFLYSYHPNSFWISI